MSTKQAKSGSEEISAKEAAKAAAAYLNQLIDNAFNIVLEEVNRDEDGRFWYITLSYFAAGDLNPLGARRQYKQFKVDATSGKVLSMTIRSV